MQPTPIKYYVLYFKVKRVHYKDQSPNDNEISSCDTLLWCAIFVKSGLMTLAL
jgi:hypothetical protein